VDLKRKFDLEIGAQQIPGIPSILPQSSETAVVWGWRGYFHTPNTNCCAPSHGLIFLAGFVSLEGEWERGLEKENQNRLDFFM